MNEIDILKKLVSFNTINDKENNLIIEWISNYLEKLGFNNKIITDEEGKMALISTLKDNPNLTFVGHTDTVNYSNDWVTNPFELIQKDNKLYGLGTCDMKGGIAAFLSVLNKIDLNKLKHGIQLVITYDEEIGFKGIESVSKYKDTFADNVLIGEPTELYPVIGTKGCMEYKAIFHGKASHSSEPLKGDNAIIKCNCFINDLLNFYEELKNEKDEVFEIPHTTMNIAMIDGGTAINIVPDYCSISFDFRTVNKKLHPIIEKKVKEIIDKYDGELFEITNIIPLNIESKEDIKFLNKITSRESKSFNYVTEGSFLDKKNSFILGPGPNMAHQCNEYITIESYNNLIEIYEEIINKYCKGE